MTFHEDDLPDSHRHGDYGHVCWEGCQAMTEKKPGEPNDGDRNAAGMIYGTGESATNGDRVYRSAINVIATYREEIEARAKREFELLQKLRDIQEKEAVTKARREGAREALERAAKIVDVLLDDAGLGRHPIRQDVKTAVRALADQPEAGGKQFALSARYPETLESTALPTTSGFSNGVVPSRGDSGQLPLGHKFEPLPLEAHVGPFDSAKQLCARNVRDGEGFMTACDKPESVHQSPAEADALPPTRCPHGYALDDDCLDCDGGPTPLGQYRVERPWRKPE